MTKRSRSRSVTDKERQDRKRNVKTHPFLGHDDLHASEQWQQRSALLDHSIALDQLVKAKAAPTECYDHVTQLIGFLQAPTADESLVSLLMEVAVLVSAWAVRTILSTTNITADTTHAVPLVVWRGFHASLERILSRHGRASPDTTFLSRAWLSQSHCHRLVPMVVRLAGRSHSGPSDSHEQVVLVLRDCLPLLLPLYRPSLEQACQSVLALVVAESGTENTVALTVVQWIGTLQRTANPRTAFQLLSNGSVLSILSKLYYRSVENGESSRDRRASQVTEESETQLQRAIRDMLSVGLLDTKQHMEGLSSLLSTYTKRQGSEGRKETSFQCYQQNLLTTIESLGESGTTTTDKEAPLDPYLAMITPLLLSEFFRAYNRIDKDKSSKEAKKKHSTAEKRARIQFAMFRLVVGSLEKCAFENDRAFAGVTLDCVQRCIDLLWQYDVYLPSLDDKSGTQFQYLKHLGQTFLELGASNSDMLSVKVLAPAVISLRTLMQLDHRIFSDRLVHLFSFCLCCHDTRIDMEVERFLSTMADIHRQLRQQATYFEAFASFLDRISSGKHPDSSFKLVLKWLNFDMYQRSIAAAVSACPFGQLQDLCSTFQTRIEKQLREESRTEQQGLVALVNLAIVVLQNTRVERECASGVAALCQGFVQTIASISNGPIRDTIKAKAMCAICAWSIELNVRASFWTGRSSDLKIPDFLVHFSLSTASDTIDGSSGHNPETSDELLLLLGHRMRELHSLVYESERLSNDRNEATCTDLVREAKILAVRVASLAGRVPERDEQSLRWALVVEHFFSSWIPYATVEDVWALLHWMFRALCTGTHFKVVQGLLLDASFYEASSVTGHIAEVAMNEAQHWVRLALSKDSRNTPRELELLIIRAMKPVDVVNALFLDSNGLAVLPNHNDAFKVAMNLDKQLRCFALKDFGHAMVISVFCGKLRCFMAGNQHLKNLIHELHASGSLLVTFGSTEAKPHYNHSYVEATGLLLGRVLHQADEAGDGIPKLLKTVRSQIIAITKSIATQVTFSRALLRELLSHPLKNPKLAQEIKDCIYRVLENWSQIQKKRELAAEEEQDKNHIYFLFGDLIQFEISSGLKGDSQQEKVYDYVEGLCLSDETEKSRPGALFAIASLSQTPLSKEKSQRIIMHIVKVRLFHPLIAASFSHLLHATGEDDFREMLVMLLDLSENASEDCNNQLCLLKLCLENAGDDSNHLTVLQNMAPRILATALRPLVRRPLEQGQAVASCSLIDELLNRRRIFQFRDVDLTRLLFHINAAIGYRGPSDEMVSIPNIVYTSCAKLFATAFQRYTKHLYACAPLVILVVHNLLSRVLYEQELKNQDIDERALRFARVCELFADHKEVYKKHVVGLVLAYVDATQGDLSLVRKNSLLPGIYSLLDTMSGHELKQLNAMMDASATVLFRSVYHNYQKIHTYKGR